jgi:hypothetical protein
MPSAGVGSGEEGRRPFYRPRRSVLGKKIFSGEEGRRRAAPGPAGSGRRATGLLGQVVEPSMGHAAQGGKMGRIGLAMEVAGRRRVVAPSVRDASRRRRSAVAC